MSNLSNQTWNPQVLTSHPIYWPLLTSASQFVESFDQWPTLSDYQQFLNSAETPIVTRSGHKLCVVPQDENQQQFSGEYEPRIYLKGELQTRQNSWHDFFQVLVWNLFPKTKATINELHFNATKNRINSSIPSQRSVLENTLTQYDECGSIIVSSDPSLLDLIKQFEWQSLFWEQRERLEKELKCVVFGHAIFEKALNPYIGMTSHSVLLTVPVDIHHSPTNILMSYIDEHLNDIFSTNTQIKTPQDLSPFPLLGLPGWHDENNQRNFYENTDYFRPGRKRKY